MDIFTELELYKKKFINFFLVPSTILLLTLVSSIFITYNCYFNNKFSNLSFILPLITFFLIFPTLKYHIIYKDSSLFENLVRISIFLILIFVLFYYPYNKIKNFALLESQSIKSHKFTGNVIKIKKARYNQKITILLKNNSKKAIIIASKNYPLSLGDQITGFGKIIKISNKDVNHFKYTMLNISYKIYSKKIKVISKSKKISFQKFIKKIDHRLKIIWKEKPLAIINALLLGKKDTIKKETLIHFKKAGVLHSLAASGMHVGIIVLIPFFFMSPLKINRKIIFLTAILFAFVYLYLTNFPISLFRAFIMFTIFSVTKIINRDFNIFNTFILSLLIIIFINPQEITNIGFKLSAGATLGIILFFSDFKKIFSIFPKFIQTSFALTLSTQIFIIPIIAIEMKEINFIGLFANIIVIPIITIILISSIFVFFISLFSIKISIYISIVTTFFTSLINYIVTFFSNIKGHFFINNNVLIFVIPVLLLLIIIFSKTISKKFPIQNWNPTKIKKNFFYSNYPILLLIITVTFSWTYLYSTTHYKKNYIKTYCKKNKKVSITITGNYAKIDGVIANYEIVNDLTTLIKKLTISKIDIYIKSSDYNNIYFFSSLIKKNPVKKCYITKDLYPANYLQKFFFYLKQDKIKLYILNKI